MTLKIWSKVKSPYTQHTLWFSWLFVTQKDHEGSQSNEPIDIQLKSVYPIGLVQERRNSIANAMELYLSCTNPSK